jgi:hypothetical protein
LISLTLVAHLVTLGPWPQTYREDHSIFTSASVMRKAKLPAAWF